MDLGSRVEDVIYTAFSSVRAGMTEKDILNYLINGFNDIGGDKLNMPWWPPGNGAACSTAPPPTGCSGKGTWCVWI